LYEEERQAHFSAFAEVLKPFRMEPVSPKGKRPLADRMFD
jgi:hypothetical protein